MTTNTLHARWTAVDAWTQQHTHPSSRPNTAALEHALKTSAAAGLRNISVSPAQGKFISLLCRVANVQHGLEVGTLGGYSAIWLCSENPQLRLTTVECNPHHADVARKNISFAGLSDRIEVITGAGLDVLPKLKEEVKARKRAPFGFVFIDADKQNNWSYFDAAADMTKSRGVICVDNVVRQGQLVDFGDHDPSVLGSRAVIEKAGRDPRVDSVVIQTVDEKDYDGCLWAVVN